MIEKVFAAIVVLGCLALLVRLMIGTRRRQRVETVLGRWTFRIRSGVDALVRGRSMRSRARREADEAIRRARGAGGAGGEWDGNVYRPKSFKNHKRRNLH